MPPPRWPSSLSPSASAFPSIGRARCAKSASIPQAVATSRKITEKLEAVQAADNFRNLFEVLVLFYALHAVHSYIQRAYDKVMRRFAVFAASFLVAVALWVLFVVQFPTRT